MNLPDGEGALLSDVFSMCQLSLDVVYVMCTFIGIGENSFKK